MAKRNKSGTAAKHEVMVVNDIPGEECRIAVVQNGHLEELYTERTETAATVGNIYKGKVTNVESAIQAAFIEFGEAQRGFLHITDVHPKYFGDDRTERVGKKIARRDRPPIQKILRRGDEVMVQVLKDGIGSKGPTLTSYLSIPGRLLVMMPDMGKVGVTRKAEDEDERRKMREILGSLDLPKEFGFILRTAGMGRTKTELKRDAAYLQRLWKVMDRRIATVGAPCELYTESDLLIRTIRDVVGSDLTAIVVDSDSAYERASAFLRVIAPRSAPPIIRYKRHAPIFHAFDVERQIEMIHLREVPLPSGGRLVIDQTEALVAIDVNSGRSRSAKDSETNAFNTNLEAADEICRQLRLRDLGGLVIHDLIDMRMARNRRRIEERFEENLKRDRSRTTTLKISEFGILEMTRQRMRPSIRMSHYIACPDCDGHGEIKAPAFVAADVSRQISFLLQYESVRKVEIVVSPRVASVLLSSKRRFLDDLEDASGKTIDVRVSEQIAADRFNCYAYDQQGADIDLEALPAIKSPSLEELAKESEVEVIQTETQEVKSRSRRRRSRKPPAADAAAIALSAGLVDELDRMEEETEDAVEEGDAPEKKEGSSGRRRRGRRGGRRRRKPKAQDLESIRIFELARTLGTTSKEIVAFCNEQKIEVKNHMSSIAGLDRDAVQRHFATESSTREGDKTDDSESRSETSERSGSGRRRRGSRSGRRRGRKPSEAPVDEVNEQQGDGPAVETSESKTDDGDGAPRKKRRRRRRGRGRGGADVAGNGEATPTSDDSGKESGADAKTSPKKKRSRRRAPRKAGDESPPSDVSTPSPVSPGAGAETESKPRRRTLYGRRTKATANKVDEGHREGDS